MLLPSALAATQDLNASSLGPCPQGSDWSVSGCWNNGAGPVPTTGDDVVIEGGQTPNSTTYNLGSAVQLKSITLDSASNNVNINGGPIVLQSGGSITDDFNNDGIDGFPAVNLNGPTTFSLTAATEQLDFTGAITGSGPLTLDNTSGTRALALESTSDSWTGGTTIAGNSWVQAFGNGAIPTTSAVTVNSGAQLEFVVSSTIGSLAGAGTVGAQDGDTLTVGGDGTSTTFAGVLVDVNGGSNVALAKEGAGTLTLTGANAYSGGTTVTGGLIDFGSLGNLGTGNLTLDGGGLQWASGTATDVSSRLNAIGGGGATLDTNGNAVTLTSALTGTGSLTKTGAGALALSGADSGLTGPVSVQQGDLVLGGSLGGTVSVDSGATLAGSGTAGSMAGLSVQSGGTLSPGAAGGAAKLTVNGAAALQAGSSYAPVLDGATAGTGYDQVTSTGAVSLAANVTLSPQLGFVPAAGDQFTILTGSSLSGTFNGLAQGADLTVGTTRFSVDYTTTSVVLTALAADGSGTMGVSPTHLTAGSTGDRLTFTYTAGAGGTAGGQVDLTVPAGWTAPTASNVTASTGTLGAITGSGPWTVPVSGLTLGSGDTLTITYSGVTAPDAAGSATFDAAEASTGSAMPTAVASSPSVTIAAGGSSSVRLTPASFSLAAGASTTVSGSVYDTHGNPVPDPQVALTSTAGSFGTVSSSVYGGFSATYQAPANPGAVTVTASVYGGGSAQTMILITPAGAPAQAVNVAAGQASLADLTATGAGGSGDVLVADYRADPAGSPTFAPGSYFDVALSAGNSFSSLTLSRCGATAGQDLYWWGGTAWQQLSDPAPTFGAGCLDVTLTATSSPSLAQLAASPFAVGTPYAPSTGGTVSAPVSYAPAVSAISPDSGTAAGGTTVTITGTNFYSPVTVDFGTAAATDVTVQSSTHIQATAPPGSGTVDVRVTTPYGTSAAGPGDQFAYTVPASQSVPTVTFSDVPAGYWAAAAIRTLAAQGIVSGYGDGTFRPQQPVTRAEFTKMLVLALGLKPGGGSTAFTDVAPTAWYAPYVAAAVRAGIVDGTSATTFAPDAGLTREEMAVLVARALKLSQTATLHFSDDGQIDPWALQGVQEAVSAGYVAGFPDGSFQPLGVTTRAEAAKVVALMLSRPSGSGG